MVQDAHFKLMEAVMSESQFYHISPKGKLTSVATVDDALAAAKNGGFFLAELLPAKERGTLDSYRSFGSPSSCY